MDTIHADIPYFQQFTVLVFGFALFASIPFYLHTFECIGFMNAGLTEFYILYNGLASQALTDAA